jgi:hypothetical protein
MGKVTLDLVDSHLLRPASGADAVFSLLPVAAQSWKLWTELGLVLLLHYLNLRGMQESIKILLPIFALFVTHVVGNSQKRRSGKRNASQSAGITKSLCAWRPQ